MVTGEEGVETEEFRVLAVEEMPRGQALFCTDSTLG